MSFPFTIGLPSIIAVTPMAVFVAAENRSSGASSALSGLGALAGDFALVLGSEGSGVPTSAGGAWTAVSGSGSIGAVYTRVLDATDLAASGKITMTGDAWGFVILRGPNSLVLKASDSVTGGEPIKTIPGFTPAPSACGLFATARHYVPGSGGTPGLPTTPITWSSRITCGNVAGNASRRLADRLFPANSPYAGANIDWTTYFGSQPSEGDEIGIYELRFV